jgi:hypothetical protein
MTFPLIVGVGGGSPAALAPAARSKNPARALARMQSVPIVIAIAASLEPAPSCT